MGLTKYGKPFAGLLFLVLMALPVVATAELRSMSDNELRSVTGKAGVAVTQKALRNPDTLQALQNASNLQQVTDTIKGLDKQALQRRGIRSVSELKSQISRFRDGNLAPAMHGASQLARAVPDELARGIGLSIGEAIIENPREFRRLAESETFKELLKIAGEAAKIFGKAAQ